MHRYFNINYELSPAGALAGIDLAARDGMSQSTGGKAQYVCVADGNILQMVHRDLEYRAVVNGAMFSICDSSWVPLFLKEYMVFWCRSIAEARFSIYCSIHS